MKTKYQPNYGIGLTWTGKDGRKYESVPSYGKRTININVSSFVNTSALGAMHWYCKVSVRTPGFSVNGEGNYLGYAGGNEPDEVKYGLDFDAERRLTKVERDMNDEIIGKIGDSTYRFNSEADAGLAGLKLAAEKFEGDWEIHFEACDGGDFKFPLSELKITKEFLDYLNKECEKCFEE